VKENEAGRFGNCSRHVGDNSLPADGVQNEFPTRAAAINAELKTGQRCAHCDPDLETGKTGTVKATLECGMIRVLGARRKKRSETSLKRRWAIWPRATSIRWYDQTIPLIPGLDAAEIGHIKGERA
jgi:hypothetical protein